MNRRDAYDVVKSRSGNVCECCGQARATSVHHRQKRSQQGAHVPSNLVHLCGDGTTGCHGWVEHHPEAARQTGYQVDSFEDPAQTPVRLRHGRVRLDNDGGMTAVPEDITYTADVADMFAALTFEES